MAPGPKLTPAHASSSPQALLSAHDSVARSDYGPVLPPLPDALPEDEEAIRIVCLVKNNQPLVRRRVTVAAERLERVKLWLVLSP